MKPESENKNFNATSEADKLLEVLELQASVPDDLVDRVMLRKNEINRLPLRRTDYSKYFQIAVVFIAAILIGVLMGKNANQALAQKKDNMEKRALIELREVHHLSDNNSFGKL